MKTLFCIAIVATCFVSVNAQTKLKPAPLSSLSYLGHTISLDDTTLWAPRVQKHFMLGWQWQGPSAKVNKRLHCNFYQDHFGSQGTRLIHLNLIPDSVGVNYLVWQHLQQRNGCAFWEMGFQRGFQFDPTCLTTMDLHNPIREGDTTGAVYGFKVRDSVYGHLDTLHHANFDRYSLDTLSAGFTDSMKYVGVVVLDKPVLDDTYWQSNNSFFPILFSDSTDTTGRYANRFIDYSKDSVIYVDISRQNGRWWYLSLNLRRTNTTDILMNNDTLLTITIPYLFPGDTTGGRVKFDSIAVDTVGLAKSLPHSRGIVLPLCPTPETVDSTKLVITRKMLPKGNATDRDITISAFFRFKSLADSTTPPNPFLRGGQPFAASYVEKLGITTRYHGRGAVSIDWMRIGTPQLERELRGELDSTIWVHADTTFKIIRDSLTAKNMRLLAFYGKDETPPECYLSMRYYSALMDGRITSEGPSFALQRVALNYDNVWSGGLGGLKNPNIPTPTIRYGDHVDKYRYYLKTGYDFRLYTSSYWSPDGSSYETRLDDKPIKRSESSDSNYFKNYNIETFFNSERGGNPGTLGAYDLYAYYIHKESPFFYSGKPWWVNNWGSGGFDYTYSVNESNRILGLHNIKPLTGEEMRLQIWTSLIHGAKGLMYDRMYSDFIQVPTEVITSLNSCSYQYQQDTLFTNLQEGYSRINFQTGMMYAISDIPDSLEGTVLINSDAAGSDFLRAGDSTHLDLILNLNTVADAMGIERGRVYLGRKSMRREVMKAHDFVYDHDQLLMSMRLVSWFGKGFYFYQTGDTAMFSRYLISDPDQYKVRPPTRTYYDSIVGKTLPFYEDPDSTFFDLTIHKVGTTPLDSSFILCALNRRTAPFLLEHDSVSGKDTIIRFVTTAEFDSIVVGNPSKKYAQSGAREITIPFNYQDSLGYALLRVKELGGGIDTVIGQDRSLAIKFLPGEGKMFKVEILHPDTTLSGNLSYTNQRKLVGFPKIGNSDSMYYHLTYHKPIPGSSPSRSAVYYRRSKAITTNSSTQNIIWQDEILVSKNIRAKKGDTVTMVNPNCAYPSLVVRYDDTLQVNRVYIVYACVDDDTCFYSTKKRIVESILRADDDTQSFDAPLKAETLGKYHGSLDEYGTPMINASDSGNYYCWADSLLGIVAGWKHTDSTYLEDTKNISYQISNAELPTGCKHPSMNSYSRLNLGENDCALVWQEKFYSGDDMDKSRILYTRLQMINGILTHYLPPTLSSGNGIQVLEPAGNMAEISNYGGETGTHYYLPSVYREIADSVYSTTSEQRDVHVDCAAWHSFGMSSGIPNGAVHRRRLSLLDTNGVANTWTSDGISRVRASGAYLNNVSLSQGDAYLDVIASYPSGGYVYNGSSRSHIMTFTESPVYTFGGSPPYRKLWQIQSNSYFAPSFHDTSLSAFQSTSKAFVIDNDGAVGQTAALPRMNTQEEWRKNRRVYEGVTVGSLRRIQASAEYFLKQTASSDIEPSIFSGFHDGESTYMLSNPILNGQMLSLERVKRLRGEAGKFGGRHGFTDTLETNWFTVGDEANLMLKSIGKNADLVSAFVERRSDGERFTVQLRTSDDTTALWTRIPLLRGGVEEYKFFMVKNSVGRREEAFTIPDYGEEMVLGAMKTSISFNKGNNDIQAIDLGRKAGAQASIRVFPNPAQDKVSVVVLGNNPKDVWHIKVMNILGHVMSEHYDKTSSLLEIVTEDYPSGVYYITAESGKLNATARFVIMK